MKYFFFFLACLPLSLKAQNIAVYKVEDLQQRMAHADTVYVVNFWATWCAPCVKELPEFRKLERRFEGKPVKILLVSNDFKEDYDRKLPAFIRRKKLKQEVVWLNETNANEFIPKIENRWGGSIPATLIVYGKTQYRNFFEGAITADQLSVLIEKQLAY